MPDFNAWFILLHRYTRQCWYDKQAVERFSKECEWAGRQGIKLLIIEDYSRNYPQYLDFWSAQTVRGFIDAAHEHGIQVLPYASPTAVDVSSDFYRFHGKECCVKIKSVFDTIEEPWAFQSSPGGGPYWQDYRGTHLLWVPADPCTGWRDYYLEQCQGLLDFGFDGIYLDQHQEATESAYHKDINKAMLEMLRTMRKMVKAHSADHVICANVMSGAPAGRVGREFIKRTRVADYGLTESEDKDISDGLKAWIDATSLQFFIFSHGNFASHKRKVALAKRLKQPLCLFLPTPLDQADPRILKLYER